MGKILCFGLLFVEVSIAQTSLNMEFHGNKNDHPAGVSGGIYSACWGYTAPDGREYAILGCYNGTAIIDITDSPTLVERAFIPGPPSNWHEMKAYRNIGYIVSESSDLAAGAGIQILDLSGLPNLVTLVKTYVWTDTISGIPTQYPRVHSVSVGGNYLYLNGGNYNGVRILDITDPVNPVKAGKYIGPYVHDSFIRNDTIFASAINSGGGVDIINATNKANPTRIQLLQYTGSGTHNAWTTIDRQHLVTTDEIGSTAKSLKVWNISNILAPAYVTQVLHDSAIVHNVFIKGNLAYAAWYTAGLRVVDLSNPSSPQVVGYYDTYPTNNAASYSGNWGADPFFPSGKVILSDMQTGLYVVRYTGDKRGKLVGKITNGVSGPTIQDALLHFKEPSITRWTGADGRYLFGYAPGTFNVVVEKPGFISKTIQATVRENQTDTMDVTLNSVVTDVNERLSQQPANYALHQNYPNPFNPRTTIGFELARESAAQLILYNLFGQEIRVLAQGRFSAGNHQIQVDASALPSGVYFYTIRTPEFMATRRMVLVK